jgi:hypothetical protein
VFEVADSYNLTNRAIVLVTFAFSLVSRFCCQTELSSFCQMKKKNDNYRAILIN